MRQGILPIAVRAALVAALASLGGGIAAAQLAPPPRPFIVVPYPPIPPEAESVPFDAAHIAQRPGPAARHFLAVQVGQPIPPAGIAFTARCLIRPEDGRVDRCDEPTTPTPFRNAARSVAGLYQFTLTPAQKSAAGPLAVTIEDRISPADLPAVPAPARPPPRVVFARLPTPGEMADYYPASALRGNVEARVRLVCRVEPDLTLFCTDARVTTPGVDPAVADAFQLAAYQVTSFVRSMPKLVDGTDAPGAVLPLNLSFQLPDE